MAVKNEGNKSTEDNERVWTMDLTAENGADEFLWNPEASGRLPEADDVALLLSSLDYRTSTVVMATRSVQASSSLLTALLEAAHIRVCNKEELDVAVRALVGEKLRSRLSPVLAGSVVVSVAEEDSELVLHFKSPQFANDVVPEGGCAEVIDMDKLHENLKELLIWNDAPMLDPLLPPEFGEAGVPGASTSWSICRHRQRRDVRPQGSTPNGLSNVSALSLFHEPTDVELVDDLREEDRINGAREIASKLQPSCSTSPGSEHAALSLGAVDSRCAGNPILASLMLAALAHLVAVAFGGTTFGSLALQAVELRGSRGCAVVFARQSQCSIM
mmetsp:Transcript_69923/g.138458  ORF Transcript_69923/g.138458 Transcript_69923/m.138458 type:complete len:330 (-) Transcript_69923:17-1006(-)